jgi:hypothetical protein
MTAFRQRLLLLVLLVAGWAALGTPCRGDAGWTPAGSLRIIVALLPGTSLSDWTAPECPALRRIAGDGALALMNTRTARLSNDRSREPKAAAVASLAAGARCAAPPSLEFPFPADGAQTRTSPNWARLQTANASTGYPVHLGNLTESLRAANVPVMAEGAGWSCLFAADSAGRAQVKPLDALGSDARWIWIADLGENAAQADAGIDRLAKAALRDHALLLIVSPFASDRDYSRDRRLTPVALWGDGVPRGLLLSHSTRRAGLICNTDLAPTLAAWFGATLQTQAFGRSEPIAVEPARQCVAAAAKIARDADAQRSAMRILPYFAIFLGVWFLATLRPFPAVEMRRRYAPSQRWGAVLPAACMASLLIARTPWELFAAVAAILIFTGVLALKLRLETLMTALSFAIVAVMTLDTLMGNPLMQRSVLGYSPIEGARYYGIGNEGMGVYLAASLILIDGLWRSGRKAARAASVAGMLAIVVVLGHFGAKAGGIAVATGLFGAYLYTALGGKWTPWRIALLPCAAAIATVLFALLDLRSPGGAQAHLGFEMRRVLTAGLPEAWSVISRKLSVELHLMWHSTWAVPLWIGLLLAALSASSRSAFSAAVLAGTLLTLAFNDAGAVASALFLTAARCFQIALGESPRMPETTNGRTQRTRPAVSP